MTVTILKDDEQHNRRTVQLSIGFDSYDQEMTQVVAHLNSAGAIIVRIREDLPTNDEGQPESQERIHLDEEEISALVEAYMAYKANAQARIDAEKARQAEVLAEAHKIAREFNSHFEDANTHIKIIKKAGYPEDSPVYQVALPLTGFSRHYVSSADELLSSVKEAEAGFEEHIEWLESHHASEENQKLIAAYRAFNPKTEAPKQADSADPFAEEALS